jgi:hypothetical protein
VGKNDTMALVLNIKMAWEQVGLGAHGYGCLCIPFLVITWIGDWHSTLMLRSYPRSWAKERINHYNELICSEIVHDNVLTKVT